MSLSHLVPRLRVRYFSAYLLLAALGFGFEWMMLHPHMPLKALWLGLLMCLSLLIAPCLWLCTLEVTENATPKLGDLPVYHRNLIAFAFLCTLPLLFSAHTGTSFANPRNTISTPHSMFIHGTMLVCVAIFCIQAPMFIRKSLNALRRHDERAHHLFSNLADRSLNALRLLMIVVAVKWLMNILRTLHCMVVGPGGGPELNVFMSLEITATLWALFVVFRHNRITSPGDQNFVAAFGQSAPEQTKDGEKYANSALDAPAKQRILGKLHRLMVEDAIYRNSELSLKLLSEQTRESPHYLSQVINQDLGGNFYEWVNGHRIEAAKRALLEQPETSVLEISEQVGFNSKSTFNAAFRRLAGITPSQWRGQFAAGRPQPVLELEVKSTDRSSRTL
jgi:AraC-like DNA-binding protein